MAASALRARFSICAVLLAIGSGCATGDGMQNKLYDATSAYNRSLRWGDIDRAAGWLPPSSQPSFMAHHDELADELVIVDYELTRLDLDKASGIATSRAEITWHTDRRLIIETTAVDQLWQWHEGQFVLVDERRSGGTPLAIFAEPGEEVHPYLPGIEAFRNAHAIGEDESKGRLPRRRAARRRQGGASPSTGPGHAMSTAAMAVDGPAGPSSSPH